MAEHEQHEEKHASGGHGGGGHGGGGHAEGEHEGAPEWLISFADNVALLMGFFVILLAMNMKEPTAGGVGGHENFPSETDRELDLIIGIREAFNTPIDMDSADPHEGALARRKREKMGKSSQPGEHGEGAEAQAVRPTDYSNLGGTVPFDDNSTGLTTRGRAAAEEVGKRIKGLRWIIEVRGHASPSESFHEFDKGMNLSFMRARAVSEALIAQGVKASQVRIVACGDSDRRIPATFDRTLDSFNQRVDVVVTNEAIPDDPYQQGPVGTPAPDTPAVPQESKPRGGH
ncbi:MAG: flagellar motor protein MotB [Phycisphaerales bacterium]